MTIALPAVCIVDTSVVVELLNVPHMATAHEAYMKQFEARVLAAETFLLSLPVLFETGNHIAQIPDGTQRRQWAESFIDGIARPALKGNSPFVATPAPAIDEVASWLEDFPDHAMQKVGLVDRALMDLFERQRSVLRGTRDVYIWSLDAALISFDTRQS